MTQTLAPALPDDAEALSALVNSAYRGDSSRKGWTTEADLLDGSRIDAEEIRNLINRPGTTILKYAEEGVIRACTELVIKGSKLYLGMLTVQPDLQGSGIGKKLLEAGEEFGRKNSCTSVYMTVISVRKELIEWYKRHGFVETGERKPFEFNDPRFGQPRQHLEFIVLEKKI